MHIPEKDVKISKPYKKLVAWEKNVCDLVSRRMVKEIEAYIEPRAVPRIVWGLRNLQNASLKSEIVFNKGSDPVEPI